MQLTGFDGRVALVTGAAGGIGECVARTLAQSGSTVAVTDVNEEAARQVAVSMREAGAHASSLKLDVSKSVDVESVVGQVERDIGPIEILVNVAGIVPRGPLLNVPDEEWDRLYAVNARGVFFCLRAVARRMVQRGKGAIVTIGSLNALVLRNELAAYGGSKAAASYITKCLGMEIAASGVRCNVVNPGTTKTPPAMARWASIPGTEEDLVRGNLANFRAPIPLNKLATTQDIAAAVMFLLSDQASHITMQDIVVDGGASMIA